MIRIGVIGYGYWGPKLVRNLADLTDVQVACVADLQREHVARVPTYYPATRVTANSRDVIDDPSIDAIVIATPVCTHFELGMEALRAGKHVLMEKPLASTSDDAERLIEEANRRGLVLMVDHTFVFTPAVQKMRDLAVAGELGVIHYYDSVRINLGLFQHDVNVLWDLAVHDLSIMDFVLGQQPTAVSATGLAHVSGTPENIAYLTMFFDGKLIGHIHVNWLAPVKIRRTLLAGSRRMLVFDDLEASEKIKVYDRGISIDQSPDAVNLMRIGYRTGDMWAPQLAIREALHGVAEHFILSIRSATVPLTDGQAGLRIVRLLEAATLSMSAQGRPVRIGTGGGDVTASPHTQRERVGHERPNSTTLASGPRTQAD
jgi:predicted dehydrogenase